MLEVNKGQSSSLADPRLEVIKRLKEQAFALIDSAISIEAEFASSASPMTTTMDELANIRVAKEFYRRGLMRMDEMSKMALPVHDPSKGEARAIKEKIQANRGHDKGTVEIVAKKGR